MISILFLFGWVEVVMMIGCLCVIVISCLSLVGLVDGGGMLSLRLFVVMMLWLLSVVKCLVFSFDCVR